MTQRPASQRRLVPLLWLMAALLWGWTAEAGGAAEIIRLQPDGSLVIIGGSQASTLTLLVPTAKRVASQSRPLRLQPLAVPPRTAPAAAPNIFKPAIDLPSPTAAGPELAELIRKYAAQYGLDPQLVQLVIRMESGFNPQAVSPKGAMGLMQLMPGTAALLGVRDPFDVEQNLAGGIRYLKMCLDRFNNQLPLALAAYNAGPENVSRFGGIPPFAETVNYVRQIMAAYTGELPHVPILASAAANPTLPSKVKEHRPPLPLPFYLGSRARLTVTLAGGAKVIQIHRF